VLKQAKLIALLRTAAVVVVNDKITRNDVRRLAGRDAKIVPYVVDTDFFEYAPPQNRSDFVLVPGNNDRHEALVQRIARQGLRVVRLTTDERVAQYHAEHNNSNLDVRVKVSYLELRDYYQTATAVVLPLVSKNHAAGQTSLLEGIACGAPLLITDGRAAGVANDFPSVIRCESDSSDTWCRHIVGAKRLLAEDDGELHRAANAIHARHHPHVVKEVFLELLTRT
jgi:hypothetical protein